MYHPYTYMYICIELRTHATTSDFNDRTFYFGVNHFITWALHFRHDVIILEDRSLVRYCCVKLLVIYHPWPNS